MKKLLNNIFKLVFLCFLSSFVAFYSCSNCADDVVYSSKNSTIPIDVISIDSALSTLFNFMECLDSKTGNHPEIESIETHFSNIAQSKDGENLPDVYAVNFKENSGFAVLGANTAVDDIVMVSENGHIDGESLLVSFDDSTTKVLDISSFPYYSEEDDDYYCTNNKISDFVNVCIKNTIDPGIYYAHTPSQKISKNYFTTTTPLLSICWSQSKPYNNYCFGNLLFNTKQHAVTGCSTTAMAMIVAHNEFPKLVVNEEVLDLAKIKTKKYATWLDNADQNHIALLMGSIFYGVYRIATSEFTLITPEQIRKRLKEFGYTNVIKHSPSEGLSNNVLAIISNMLSKNKPVFISAIPANFQGHSWVIDGAKYSNYNKSTFLPA